MIPNERFLATLSSHGHVDFIEADGEVSISAQKIIEASSQKGI